MEAHALFEPHKDTTLKALASLFDKYPKFGCCLVHAHFQIEQGEKVVANGLISKPEIIDSETTVVYPENWTADGVAYEFTVKPTATPPYELFDEFAKLIPPDLPLGIYAVDDDDISDNQLLLEYTEGRSNISTLVPAEAIANNIETAWIPSAVNPVMRGCRKICEKGQSGHYQRHSSGRGS